MATGAINAKTYTIHLQADQARQLDALAQNEQRPVDDLFAEAVQLLWADRVDRVLDEVASYAETRTPPGLTEADVPRLVRESRAETSASESRPPRRVARAS